MLTAMTGWTITLAVTSMTISWFLLYNVSQLIFSHKSAVWHCRLVILIHGVVACSLIWFTIQIWNTPWPRDNADAKSTPEEILVLIITLSFFLFETSWILWHQETKSKAMTIHHIFSILGITAMLYLGESGAEACMVIFVTELTSPLLIVRWFMADAKCKGIYMLPIELIIVSMFIFLRIITGTSLMYRTIMVSNLRYTFKTAFLAIYIVSCAFTAQLVRVIVHRVRNISDTIYKDGVNT